MSSSPIPASTTVVVLGDYEHAMADQLRRRLPGHISIIGDDDAHPSDQELLQKLSGARVVVTIRERTLLPGALLRKLPELELIVTTGSNTSVIDLNAGIPVCATRSQAAAPAELTWALILATARNLVEESQHVQAGKWQQRVGMGLAGKQLGIIGLGRIGSRVARVADAFGMEVAAWSPNLRAESARACRARPLSKAELLASSDVVSLHLRLGPRSREVIDAAALALMQPHAILINTARAGLVHEPGLVQALSSKSIAGLGQDVFTTEPLPMDSPLRGLPGVVLTPHLGYMTDTNLELFAADIVEDINGFYAGRPLRWLN